MYRVNDMDRNEKIAFLRELQRADHVGEDQIKLVNDLLKEPDRLLTMDDEFHFDNSVCVGKCDGNCCTGDKIIRLTPIDMDYLVKGMPFLSRQTIADNLDIFLGSRSMIPMAVIRFARPSKKLSICPFCAIKIDARNRKLLDIRGICVAGQKNKPPACFWFPLGRYVRKEQQPDGEIKDISLFFAQNCPGTKTDKTLKIRDFVEMYKDRENDTERYSTMMHELIEKAKKKLPMQLLERILQTLSVALFREDGSFDDKFATITKFFESMGMR